MRGSASAERGENGDNDLALNVEGVEVLLEVVDLRGEEVEGG